MTIVVGYTPTPAGRAALTLATAEARKSDRPLVVVNTSRGDALDEPSYARPSDLDQVRAALTRGGVEVIDAPVDRFASEVADRYLALKASGRL